jgi:hypothetical protein
MLIPNLGAIGAMVGTIMAEMVVCIWQTVVVRKELPVIKFIKSFLPFVPAGIVMFILVLLIGNMMGQGVLTLAVQVLVGAICYLSFSLIYFVKVKNEVVIKTIDSIRNRIEKYTIHNGVRENNYVKVNYYVDL